MGIKHLGGLVAIVMSAHAWAGPVWANPTWEPTTEAPVPPDAARRVLRLGLYNRDSDAWQGWDKLIRHYGSMLDGLTPVVTPLTLNDGRVVSGLVAQGPATTDVAERCRRLVDAGAPCMVQAIRTRPATPPASPPTRTEVVGSTTPAAVSSLAAPKPPAKPRAPLTEPTAVASAVPPAPARTSGEKAIRLGFYTKEADAQRGWQTLTRHHPQVFEGLTPVIYPTELPGRGTFHVLAAVALVPTDLTDRCVRLKDEGEGCTLSRLPSAELAASASTRPPVAVVVAPLQPEPEPELKRESEAPPMTPVISGGLSADPSTATSANSSTATTAEASTGTAAQPGDIPAAVPAEPPPARQDRIIISIADKKLYYTSTDGAVRTFPVAVARSRKLIVTGETHVVNKRVNPIWRPTPEMRKKDPKLPVKVGPGPKNPMGAYSLDLGWQYIRIHGTNEPQSIGGATSSGCYRMHASDIKALYKLAGVGTPVQVVEGSVQRGDISLTRTSVGTAF